LPGRQIPPVPAKVIDRHRRTECVGLHKEIMPTASQACRLQNNDQTQPARLPLQIKWQIPASRGNKFPACCHRDLQRKRRNIPGCSLCKPPAPRAFFRQPRERALQSDRLLSAYRPKTRCVCDSVCGSCLDSGQRIPTACRRRRKKKYESIARVSHEQIQAAARFFRKTFLPQPCLLPVGRCDRSNAFSCCDFQRCRRLIQLPAISNVERR